LVKKQLGAIKAHIIAYNFSGASLSFSVIPRSKSRYKTAQIRITEWQRPRECEMTLTEFVQVSSVGGDPNLSLEPLQARSGDRIIWRISIMTGGFILCVFAKRARW